MTSFSSGPAGVIVQVHTGIPVQKLQLQVQFPLPLHEPRVQFTLQLGMDCAYTRWTRRGDSRSITAATNEMIAI